MSEKNIRAHLESEVRTRALKDPKYREQLLADPIKTMKGTAKEIGIDPKVLDTCKTIHIHEEKPGELHLGIPSRAKSTKPVEDDDCPGGGSSGCPSYYTCGCSVTA